MPITRPPLPYPSEEVKTRLAKDPTLAWLREIAAARRIGLGAVIRDIVETERGRDSRRPAHKRLALMPARDTQPPASTPESSGLAPVSQQGGDDTSTPADSIRDEADPGGPSAEEVPAPEGIAGDVWNG